MFRIWVLVMSLAGLSLIAGIASAQDGGVNRIEATATLEVIRRVPISTEVAGRIISVNPADEGVLVGAGDELIRLDDAVIQAEVERADLELRLQTEIEFAKKSLEVAIAEEQQKKEANTRRPGAFNPSEIRQVQLEVEKSEASLRKANDDKLIQGADLKIKQAQLAQYTVRAPFDGLVTLIKVFPGQNVRPGEQVLELTDMSLLRARVKVSAKERRRLFVGDKVELVISEDAEAKVGQSNDTSKKPVGEPAANRPGVASLLNPRAVGTGNSQPAADVPGNEAATVTAPRQPPSADRVFIGEIRFIDPVLDNVSGNAVINLSVYVPNRVDRFGRYLLYQGMKVEATVLSQPRE
ncbi:MAG: efflux RND transporter periplasmic adaptor subunit [Planctomycetota bacterium]